MPEFKCEQCGKVFSQEMSLKQHINDKHMQKPAQQVSPSQHTQDAPRQEHKPDEAPRKMKIKIGKSMIYLIIGIVVAGAGGYGVYAFFGSQPGGNSSAASSLSAPIGPLGSTHIHADFAVFLDGKEITPLPPKYYVRNQFVHVEEGTGPGTVIHMHATNVPIGFFFRSLGMNFNSECFRLDNGKELCNSGDKTLKMFVKHGSGDWAENRQFHTYVFSDLDKILVTYGNETEDEIKRQQDAVTDFAVANSDRGSGSGVTGGGNGR